MNKVLRSYVRKLTNLSSANKSLLMLRLSEADLDLHALDFLYGKPSFSLLEQVIKGSHRIALSEVLDSRNALVNESARKLKSIQRREKMVQEELGAKDLYVAWPFVRGKFSDGTIVRCPLLFFPVELVQESGTWILNTRKEVGVSINKSFLVAYAHYNQMRTEDELADAWFEDYGKDSKAFRIALYQLLKDSALELNFTQELFADKLQNFDGLKKQFCEDTFHTGVLKLFPEAVLGLFPQSGSFLVPDYEQLIEQGAFAGMEDFFVSRSGQENTNDFRLREEQTFTPFPVDASQENAMREVKSGASIVVQGPPGTGKSQLICNLICDFTARGKKVLVVCQKRAALDVVYERLKAISIQDFIGLVHDFKDDRNDIFKQINTQIDRVESYRIQNSSLDAMQLERLFLQSSRKIDSLIHELQSFKNALFGDTEFGTSVKELYLTSNPLDDVIPVAEVYGHFTIHLLADFLPRVQFYFDYVEKIGGVDHAWRDRVDFKTFSHHDKQQMSELIDHIPAYWEQVAEKIRNLPLILHDIQACERLIVHEASALQLMSLLRDSQAFDYFKAYLQLATDLDFFLKKKSDMDTCFECGEMEVSLADDELEKFKYILNVAIKASNNIFSRWSWQLFSPGRAMVSAVLKNNKLEQTAIGLQILSERLERRIKMQNILDELKKSSWLKGAPASLQKEEVVRWFQRHQAALEAKRLVEAVLPLKTSIDFGRIEAKDFMGLMKSVLETLRLLSMKKNEWLTYFTGTMLEQIIQSTDIREKLKLTLESDFELMIAFDDMKHGFTDWEIGILKNLEKSGHSGTTAVRVLDNSLRLEWVRHIEQQHPVLKAVSSLRMEQMETELQAELMEKLRLSQEVLVLRLRESIYKSNDFNRLNNRTTYRELKHQVGKRKKIWPLRKIIDTFPEELFLLMPCWLASPESVSAIFPMKKLFDLVIFDEASQCFAEQGIPSVYRGKQIVISGDSHQLRPSDIYRAKYEGEEEEDTDSELESLLEIGQKYLREFRLQQHYRSRSAELIYFSNMYFYEHCLQMLPEVQRLNMQEPAIVCRKVNGVWKDNMNREEAQAVVAEVVQLLREGIESIGVIAFNHKQAALIGDLLELYAIEHLQTIPDKLFVKNIENVQGDERDVIIFSLGYAPDERGKMIMQFGSLNQEYGQNRLNVAVTRARDKIILVTSILPEQLHVDESKNEGPKLLRNYLAYAFNVSKGRFAPEGHIRKKFSGSWYLSESLKNNIKSSDDLDIVINTNFADLVLKQGGKYKGLLLTDDQAYKESESIKDFHAYKAIRAGEKGWKLLKVYSRKYWNNKNDTLEEIQRNFKVVP